MLWAIIVEKPDDKEVCIAVVDQKENVVGKPRTCESGCVCSVTAWPIS